MAKYIATRKVNRREGEYLTIYATSDEQAKYFLQNAIKSNRDDWEYIEDSLDAAATDDAVFDLECVEGQGDCRPVEMGFRPKSQMPYSDEARDFVIKLGSMKIKASTDLALAAKILEARKLCGME